MAKKIDNPETLLEIARQGQRKLTPRERRRVILFLDQHRHDEAFKDLRSNYQLGVLFNITESAVRVDRKKLLEDAASHLTPAQAIGFVSDFLRAHDALIRRAEMGLDACVAGGLGEHNFIRLLSDLYSKRVKLAQEAGIVDHNLGRLTVTEETWVATTAPDGQTTLRDASGEVFETAVDESDA